MNEFKIVTLSNGVEGGFIKTEKFKTSILSFSFYIPHSEKAADFALLSEIITNVSSPLNFKSLKRCGGPYPRTPH